jgi:mercuric ion transport protein
MNNKRLLKTGLVGTVVMALCCFTPLLVWLLAAVGLSAVVGMLDYVLLPALGMFLAITIYALIKRSQAGVN